MVRNKLKRKQMHVELKKQKIKMKRDQRKKRAREIEELGDKVRPFLGADFVGTTIKATEDDREHSRRGRDSGRLGR